ncbi:MAG: hypothetical protein ACXAEN_22940 [Candidatus Thorarchaeota archaeon]
MIGTPRVFIMCNYCNMHTEMEMFRSGDMYTLPIGLTNDGWFVDSFDDTVKCPIHANVVELSADTPASNPGA